MNIGRAGNNIRRLLDIAFEQRFKPTILGNDIAINEENGLPASLSRAKILLIIVRPSQGQVRTLPRKGVGPASISARICLALLSSAS